MTHEKLNKKRKIDLSSMIKCIVFSALTVILLLYLPQIKTAVHNGMLTAALSVIPSLFPFMVISAIISKSGTFRSISSLIARLTLPLLGISKYSVEAILLGSLGGYPVGARLITNMYGDGKITKEEAEAALVLSHNSGLAFTVGFTGQLLWGSTRFGWYLYAVQLIVSFCLGAYFSIKTKKELQSKAVAPIEKKEEMGRIIVDCITESANTCIRIVGFIVASKVISELTKILFQLNSSALSSIVASFLELSDGCISASHIGGVYGAVITGFSIGFGGLSALLQGVSFTSAVGLSMKKCTFHKLIQGIFVAFLCLIAFKAKIV